MATDNSTATTSTGHAEQLQLNDKITALVDEERGLIALDALQEIDGLAALIAKELHQSCDVELLAIRGIAMRIMQLNSIALSAVGDQVEILLSLRALKVGVLESLAE